MSEQEVRLPESTQAKLAEFQRQVRRIKVAEGILAGLFGLLLSWVVVFSSDRFVDTSGVARAAILATGCLGFGLFFPLKYHRWVWGTRSMRQVARLVSHRYPALGDQLLGVVELATGEQESGESRSLKVAAMEQVDAAVRERDLTDAVPRPRSRHWAVAAAVPVLLLLLSATVVPDAAWNAVGRWLMPWRDIDRFTFAQIETLPQEMVIPQGEEFSLNAQLRPSTQWHPETGRVFVEDQPEIQTARDNEHYDFTLPPQSKEGTLSVRIGDVREKIALRPEPRPELTAMTATVLLPEYLQYRHHLTLDVRGGSFSAVQGAQVTFAAEISRTLAEASVSGDATRVNGTQLQTPNYPVSDSTTLHFTWTDELGLTSRQPFPVNLRAVEDTAPQVACIQDEPLQVVLSTDVITFSISTSDDYGIRTIGLEWAGVPHPLYNPEPDHADKVVQAGGPEERTLSTQATFCAQSDNVRPQALRMRAWAEDYLPGRARAYSPEFVLHVLTPEDHAVWVAEQLRRWASRADDVYEQEMRLHDVNRQLRRMDPQSLATPETRRQIAGQVASERANAQRLSQLTGQGDRLINQAMRNPEMLVGHLETFAQALKQLRTISQQKMPSVADLLQDAEKTIKATPKPGQAPSQGKSKNSPVAGNDRSRRSGQPVRASRSKKDGPAVPALVDKESGFNPADEGVEEQENLKDKSQGSGKFGLPSTVLSGGPKPRKKPQPPPHKKLNQAVEEQHDLLAEFENVRDDLQKIMDDLDNSTFVKRLKAASRRQLDMAADLNRTLFAGFGMNTRALDDRQKEHANRIAEREEKESETIWLIKSDLEAYFSRRREDKFRRIVEQMDETNIVSKLESLGVRVRNNMSGDSISRTEFWADTLDRWAEELVAPSKCGACKSSNSKSLPPGIVLEIMRIQEGEIDLRDETRAAETAREAVSTKRYVEKASTLSDAQTELRKRTLKVIDDILALPEGAKSFGKELTILDHCTSAMQDAVNLLDKPSTDDPVIAAETEVIELLLQARRSNPNGGGGGGGSSPGGGGEGDTQSAAIALHGPGSDPNAHIESRETRQSTGTTANEVPAEYRDGLEAFINAVESGS